MTIDEQLKQEYDNLPEFELGFLDGSTTKVKLHNPILFGRWLLKYSSPVYFDDGLCWQYENDYYDTNELYLVFAELERKLHN